MLPFLNTLILACYFSYIVTWTAGAIIFQLLRKFGKEGLRGYFSSGFGLGVILPFVVILFHREFDPQVFAWALTSGVVGSIIAISFMLIRGGGTPETDSPEEPKNR